MRAQAPREDAHAQQARRRQFAAGDRPRRPGSFHGSPSSQNSAYSVPREDSPLLGLETPVAGEENKEAGSDYGGSDTGSRRTTHSNAPTTMSAADEALLGTFMEVLSEGEKLRNAAGACVGCGVYIGVSCTSTYLVQQHYYRDEFALWTVFSPSFSGIRIDFERIRCAPSQRGG